MAVERNRRVALLGRSGSARERLHEALDSLGLEIVLEVDPEEVDADRIRQAAPHALLVILEPAIEDALDMLGPVLENPALNVLFEEADLILRRSGWDVQRWTRHLASKLHIDTDVLPARQPDSPEETVIAKPAVAVKSVKAGTLSGAKTSARAPVAAPKTKKPAAEDQSVVTPAKSAKPAGASKSKVLAADGMDRTGMGAAPANIPAESGRYAPMGNKASAAADSPPSGPAKRKAPPSPRASVPPPLFEPDKGAEIFEFMESVDGAPSDTVPSAPEQNPFDPVLSEIELASGQTPSFEFQSSSLEETTKGGFDEFSDAGESGAVDSDFVLSWEDPDGDVVIEVDPTQEFPPPERSRSAVSARNVTPSDKTAPVSADERPAKKAALSGLSLERHSDEPVKPTTPAKRPGKAAAVDEVSFGSLELAPLDAELPLQSANTTSAKRPDVSPATVAAPVIPPLDGGQTPKSVAESTQETMRLVDIDASSDTGAEEAGSGVVLVLAGIGGPDAVRKLLADLPTGFSLPLLVQLRLDGGRYDNLVRQISRVANQPVQLAEADQILASGNVYVLPDYIGVEQVSGGMRFVNVDQPGEIIEALPPAGSAVLFLSGSDPTRVDAAFEFAACGGWLAGQSLEGCYDATAVKLLAAHGVALSSPSGLVAEMIERWG